MKKILVFLFWIPVCCYSQSWQDTVGMIEKIFDRYKATNPGCQLAISRNGQLIFSQAWGMADMEHGIALTNESIIEAGSVSKQFTAACILLLEQQGKLSLNDDVRKYVPELPDYGTTITLRHMMTHASGLKDWGSIAAITGWPRSTKTYNNDDALYIISRQKTLNHQPGAEYIYSNSNYNLFAIIVERVSGKSLAEFSRVNIFEPAGMKHTEWRNNFKKIVVNRAIAYEKAGNGYQTDMPNEYVYGNGGLLTTVEDLLTWNNYYLNGKLGNPSLLQHQLTTYRLNNGRMNPYGAGLRVDSSRGWRIIEHTGATASYRSSLRHFPELGLSVAWLSNTSEFDRAGDPSDSVISLLVKDKTTTNSRTNPVPVQVPIEKLNSYAGWYMDSRTANAVKLFVKDGKLENNRGGNLVPVSENVFMLGSNRIEIHHAKPNYLLFISALDSIYYYHVDSAKVDVNSLQEYTGEYYSEDAEVSYQVIINDGKLMAHRDPKTDYTLTPIYKDGFGASGTTIYFTRDKKKRITGMSFFVGRARNVPFVKVNHK